jgi:peptidoglycan hydrolase CwlO-like protein
MVMLIPWVNVNIHCCELEIKECKQELKLKEKEIKELKQQIQKMDSCKIHVHYHY